MIKNNTYTIISIQVKPKQITSWVHPAPGKSTLSPETEGLGKIINVQTSISFFSGSEIQTMVSDDDDEDGDCGSVG